MDIFEVCGIVTMVCVMVWFILVITANDDF
jgi:hypothetical protein